MSDSSKLLINESPLQVLPTLVLLVGLSRAVVLQEVQYLLAQPKSGRIVDGQKWIFNTYQEWAEYFTFWHPTTIQQHFQALEKDGYILTAQFDREKGDNRKYYRIDYDRLNSALAEMQDHRSKSTPIHQSKTTPTHRSKITPIIEVKPLPPIEVNLLPSYKEHETSLHETSSKTSLHAHESAQLIQLPSTPASPIHEQLENAIQSGCGLQIVAPNSWEDRAIAQAATALRALNPPVTVAEVGLFFEAQKILPGLGWVASTFQQWRAQQQKQQQPAKPRLTAIEKWKAGKNAK